MIMLKEILSVTGKPGLYKLVSKGSNLSVIESLSDKKRIPAYPRDKIISLGNLTVFTDESDVSIGEVLTKIKEKEEGGKIPFDISKADNDVLRAYLSEALPNFDRERVYPSDIRKMLKWYELLIENGITDFSKKDEEAGNDEVKEEKEPVSASGKRKDSTMSTIKPGKATAAKPMPKNAAPKKSVVGAKRGS